ncbi:MAG: hypothetical protein WEB90_05235 [Gemmatimonadota bacterium]
MMRRFAFACALALALSPVGAGAQVRLMGGVGLSTPIGAFADAADVGWHLMAGLQLGVPEIPVAIRADGGHHSFGESSPVPKTSMLAGALSLVVDLPGVGLVPYLLGGVGRYRTSVDGFDATSDSGIHGAFGVNIGALGPGGFGEVRLVNVSRSGDDARLVTATIGFRL